MGSFDPRKRDLLEEGTCVVCNEGKVFEFGEDDIVCNSCLTVLPRWMDKAEIAAVINNHENTVIEK